jgi:NTP pyrophosphatase (non-canonical NTP hydrolase)
VGALNSKLEGLFERLESERGRESQVTVCIEECAELIKELTKFVRGKHSTTRICEEIADVTICLAQMSRFFNTNGKVQMFLDFKTQRLEAHVLEGNP